MEQYGALGLKAMLDSECVRVVQMYLDGQHLSFDGKTLFCSAIGVEQVSSGGSGRCMAGQDHAMICVSAQQMQAQQPFGRGEHAICDEQNTWAA